MQKNNSKGPYFIYVTVGVPFSRIPMVPKAAIFVDTDNGQTDIQAAKDFRAMVCNNIEAFGWVRGTNLTPSELYFEIYAERELTIPYAGSSNSPYIQANMRKENGR